jgi:hypothetical protein
MFLNLVKLHKLLRYTIIEKKKNIYKFSFQEKYLFFIIYINYYIYINIVLVIKTRVKDLLIKLKTYKKETIYIDINKSIFDY